MNDNYSVRYAIGPRETNQMGTKALRDEFLIDQVFGCLLYTSDAADE